MNIEDEIKEAWEARGWQAERHQPWENEVAKSGFEIGYITAKEKYAPAPQPRIIDLSVVAGPDAIVPMEFSDDGIPWIGNGRTLVEITPDLSYPYYDGRASWERCRFDTARPVFWRGGECPLPEGVMCTVLQRNSIWKSIRPAMTVRWSRSDRGSIDFESDIIAFQVTGLADGWVYPWEAK